MTNDEVINDLAGRILLYRSMPGYNFKGETVMMVNILEMFRFSLMERGVSPDVALNTANKLRSDVMNKLYNARMSGSSALSDS